jgi:hypothetical protein
VEPARRVEVRDIDEISQLVVVTDSSGDPVLSRQLPSAEARVFASSVSQHLALLSPARFDEYYPAD